MSEVFPPDLTPEDVEYYELCAQDAWNEYQATGDEEYAYMTVVYFARMMILEQTQVEPASPGNKRT